MPAIYVPHTFRSSAVPIEETRRPVMPHLRHSPTAACPSQIKSTFRMSRGAGRREPRRRHARACPRRVCWPLCAWTIRATIRGARPIDFAAFTGTPGGMPMAFVRCYTGTDDQSHFEDLDLLPPDMERSIEQAASRITFTRSPNGRFSDWHNAPRRQYAIFLSGGQMEVVIGDGTTRRFGPGDAVLSRDRGTPAGASVGAA